MKKATHHIFLVFGLLLLIGNTWGCSDPPGDPPNTFSDLRSTPDTRDIRNRDTEAADTTVYDTEDSNQTEDPETDLADTTIQPDTVLPDISDTPYLTPDSQPDTTAQDSQDIPEDQREAQCFEKLQIIYIINSDKTLYSFDPQANEIERVGYIECGTSGEQPFSMSVSRDGIAYVLYTDSLFGGCSGLYKVDIITGQCLGRTSYSCYNAQGFDLFGMGFASDGPGSFSETLYIGKSDYPYTLASLDLENWQITPIGPISGAPEMTGTGVGELWAFFAWASPPSVAQLNKTTGAEGNQTVITTFDGTSAFAFAQWGGAFFMFHAPLSGSTSVWRLYEGNVENFMPNTGLRIVGAGVSTCAPTVWE